MVKLSDEGEIFSALANPTRREILEVLRSKPQAISDLAEPFEMSLVAVSKHVHLLEGAGLVRIERDGRSRICHLDPEPLRAGIQWMARFATFWRAELDQIERSLAEGDYLAEDSGEEYEG